MKTFGLALLGAMGGYLCGLFGGMLLIDILSSNTYDRSLEAAMTSAFVVGPLMAVIGIVVVLVYRMRRAAS
ncbi:MAG TPA: hypothetical protein VFS39_17930 [Nitrospira sp.]|nr:hypothetical protein [Nitrospira sp.]